MRKKLLSLGMAVIFAPAGVQTLRAAFKIVEPHIFVMFVFSGSLMLLLGLAGLIGLLPLTGKGERIASDASDDDCGDLISADVSGEESGDD
ncbi:MAG: hypothetical protein LBJ64_04475 [Deltaproteobacteria bacterium]|jgi:hypothetical protein|nr:hypothetical protein [Deltaproteobacteria bacterium]